MAEKGGSGGIGTDPGKRGIRIGDQRGDFGDGDGFGNAGDFDGSPLPALKRGRLHVGSVTQIRDLDAPSCNGFVAELKRDKRTVPLSRGFSKNRPD